MGWISNLLGITDDIPRCGYCGERLYDCLCEHRHLKTIEEESKEPERSAE